MHTKIYNAIKLDKDATTNQQQATIKKICFLQLLKIETSCTCLRGLPA
jgi:hypothetical protein